MMDRAAQVQRILEERVVGIIRVADSTRLVPAIEAMIDGGLRVLEVTLTVPGALDIVRQVRPLADQHGVMFGVGTVLDAVSARLAILAGADFIVSPVMRPDMIETCTRYGAVAVPGCATPTEMLAAWDAGADFVKVFPATALGGPDFIRMVLAPLPQLRVIATGGILPDAIPGFLAAGCKAVGSGYMISDALLEAGDFAEIARRAAHLRQRAGHTA